MKTTTLAFALSIAALFPAFACNNPGTPNPVFAFATGPNTIQLKITNTATEGSEHTIWFLAQDRKGNVQRFTQGRILDGDFAVFNENGLLANTPYCFRVWTRVDTTDGCESKQPSGYVCATTQAPYQTALSVSNNAREDGSSTPPQTDPQGAGSGSGSSGSGTGSGSGSSGSGSGTGTGTGTSGGICVAAVTGVKSSQAFGTKDNQICCTNPAGSCDNLCCPPGLICPVSKHWYCNALN